MTVTLKEVTRETLRAVCKLDAGDGATQVAPNAVSIAEASFYDEAWFRAIYEDDTPVGFVMLYDPTLVGKARRARLLSVATDDRQSASAQRAWVTPRSSC